MNDDVNGNSVDVDKITGPQHMRHQYLIYQVDDTLYSIKLAELRNVIPMRDITPVPGCTEHFLGLISVRGTIIPVLNFSYLMSEKPGTVQGKYIVILKDGNENLGLPVDNVLKIQSWSKQDLLPVQANVREINAQYYTGVFKYGNRYGLVLNTDNLLSELPGADDEA